MNPSNLKCRIRLGFYGVQTLHCPTASGNWWALSEDGLYRFENLQNLPAQIYHQSDGLTGNSLFRGFRDSLDNLWFSTRFDDNHTGLTKFDVSTRRFHSFTASEGYPPDRSPVSFAEDAAGNFWFGFYETGMVRLRRETGRFDFFTPADGVPRGVISALDVDSNGRLWIGSSAEGLGLIENPTAEKPTFTHLTTSEGLGSNNVRSLIEDLRGNIYVGTVRGIDRLNPQTGRIRHFSTADGLAGDYIAPPLSETTLAVYGLELRTDFPNSFPKKICCRVRREFLWRV